jgi:hypothetical protein
MKRVEAARVRLEYMISFCLRVHASHVVGKIAARRPEIDLEDQGVPLRAAVNHSAQRRV